MNAPTDIRAIASAPGFRASHHAPAGHGHSASIPIATPLQRLVTAALAAEDALLCGGRFVTEAEYARLDDAAITARVALREYLATQGLTVEQINRMGEVI